MNNDARKPLSLDELKARARELSRSLGRMRESGHETDRAAIRRELESVNDAIRARS